MPFESQHIEVYSPEEDTFLLLKAANSEAKASDLTLEIGCGSGLISQELAYKVRGILATDINPHAVRATKANGIETIRADLFSGIKGKFDLILFNPPYLPTNSKERTQQWINYALDGGVSGRDTIGRFIGDLRDHLRPGGRALLLISSLTGLNEVKGIALAAGLDVTEVASSRCFFEQLYVLRLEVMLTHKT
jgi:release factor glutamine methyltransferase